MGDETILEWICKKLMAEHRAHTILLYGSRADGSAGKDSDYDLAAFGPINTPFRIARLVKGEYLDVWAYPEAELQRDPNVGHLRLGTAGSSSSAEAKQKRSSAGSRTTFFAVRNRCLPAKPKLGKSGPTRRSPAPLGEIPKATTDDWSSFKYCWRTTSMFEVSGSKALRSHYAG